MLVKRLTWAAVVLLTAALAPAADRPHWQGTWAATAGTAAFAGTWDAAPGQSADTLAGTWALRDQNGAELAAGTWAAGKEGKLWKGTWQARRASGQVYNGTWRAQVELPGTSRFSDLFEAAIFHAVSGGWRRGAAAGAWTIRAYAQR